MLSRSSYSGHIDRLIDCRSMLEGIGWHVAQCQVQSHVVVEADDVLAMSLIALEEFA